MRDLLRHGLPMGALVAGAVACNAGAPGGAAAPHVRSEARTESAAPAAPPYDSAAVIDKPPCGMMSNDDCVRAMQMERGWVLPFSRDAAAQTLADIASKLASCRAPDGPTGAGKVKIVFEPTGQTSSVELIEGPYRGTATGSCVVERFRQAHVPPFDGSAVPANKSVMVPEN